MLRHSLGRIAVHRYARRQIHQLPTLKRIDEYRNSGIPGLYSPTGFGAAWTEYQTYLLDRLSELTAGTDFEDKSPLDIVLKTSRTPEHSVIFNYASLAFNNHFYISALNPAKEVRGIPPTVEERIVRSFQTVEALKELMFQRALGMFGNGFVWLVELPEKVDVGRPQLAVVNTYNAGTVFDEARRQQLDLTGTISSEQAEAAMDLVKRPPGALGRADVLPILAVNMWQYAFLQDYGPAKKRDYLENWWNSIDWDVVGQRLFPGPDLIAH
ncbi:hypothetical protein CANCADRAFT_30851 [Tortispora caseinolytica NRRL Y-17796]|uniref:Manganese/iron superoxide dismutase C-terminal domain-containing protein n=1 Tax=Tortispora caseinolytica NRRL Y-17796 TaxID=767744 RepID=A0A1E4TM31_9ASCO|nr:hypothetical protein CANCADRAFT_30851 [Tortispora caseinolytica NRRL Y-17796]